MMELTGSILELAESFNIHIEAIRRQRKGRRFLMVIKVRLWVENTYYSPENDKSSRQTSEAAISLTFSLAFLRVGVGQQSGGTKRR